ncbi:MAG: UDP-N-acetylmuramoyl-tripeptide--D-alanyl-D-alanine ligase [Pseudomonadota bacterium]
MIVMRLGEAARAMRGWLRGSEQATQQEFRDVSTDTRKAVAGTLFFALKGANHDGHDHAAAARAAGAVATVVARDDAVFGEPRIVVDDTLFALGRLAATRRAASAATVVAITGNSGKTTTREFTAAVLRRAGTTLATQGNLNNEIGVPLTLLSLDENDSYAVVELGQGRPGDIAYLIDIVQPDIALVTNVTGAHLAGFGTLEAIAAGKGEVYAALKPDGVAIINCDDSFAEYWRARLPACRVIGYSAQEHAKQGLTASVRAEAVTTGSDGCARFTLVIEGRRVTVSLAVPGLHNVSNALAAASVGLACGVAPEAIAAALAEVQSVSGRLTVRMLPDGVRLIDDTYNANPGSVKAAVRTLCSYPGRRLLVLGHMAELGPTAASLHREVGAFASAAGVDALFVTGDFSGETAAGFGAGARAFADVDALVTVLRTQLAEARQQEPAREVTVLVKGSRSARMERVVAALTGEKNAALAH